MDRTEYNTCVANGLKGKRLNKEERKLEFCIVSKLCSEKAKNREEAKYLCSMPKELKAPKLRRNGTKSCEKEVLELAHCIAENIDMDQASNINSIEIALVNAMMECKCEEGE